jgi:hypothetical protein
MSWIKLLDNSHFLETLFPNAPPALSCIRVHGVQFHQDGPVLLIDFDLNSYPKSPPAKWLSGEFNTVQVRLMGIDIRELTMTGWSTNNVGRLEFARDEDRTTVKFDAPGCSLQVDAMFVRVDRVSAYHNDANADG